MHRKNKVSTATSGIGETRWYPGVSPIDWIPYSDQFPRRLPFSAKVQLFGMGENNKISQNRSMGWTQAMLNTFAVLSEEEKAKLHDWEKENLGNPNQPDVGTSDWPGWRKYIGPPPWRREDWSESPGGSDRG
jgi:hypothetical protein